MKFYFPIHLDGGNRGCEGIAKGTALILNETKANLVGLCRNIPLDTQLGIANFITLIPYNTLTLLEKVYNKIIKVLKILHIGRHFKYKEVDQMRLFLRNVSSDSIMISTGGDMMCYDDFSPSISSVNIAKEKGIKTVLWGCSMGKENLTPQKEIALKNFSLIYARESLSYNFFKSIGLENVICFPDPAFVLESEICKLPECFRSAEIVGLNLSNFIIGNNGINTPFGDEVRKLLRYIFDNTVMHVLLVPHVMWQDQDDRLICNAIISEFKNYSSRISVLDSERRNYLQIRYVISKCHSFIGARTHAVISAYSTCVPAIALGYSIKSKGIAKDLHLPDELVVDTVHEIKPGQLLKSFLYLEANYSTIKSHLQEIMPAYRKKAYQVREFVKHI